MQQQVQDIFSLHENFDLMELLVSRGFPSEVTRTIILCKALRLSLQVYALRMGDSSVSGDIKLPTTPLQTSNLLLFQGICSTSISPHRPSISIKFCSFVVFFIPLCCHCLLNVIVISKRRTNSKIQVSQLPVCCVCRRLKNW